MNAIDWGTILARAVGFGLIVQALCFAPPWHLVSDFVASGLTNTGTSSAGTSLHEALYVASSSYVPAAAQVVVGLIVICTSRFWGRLIARGLEKDDS
jgi:hypothetical protein